MALIRGCLAFLCYVINTFFWVFPIVFFSLLKLLPLAILKNIFSKLLDGCASGWINVNTIIEKVFHPTRVHLSGDLTFKKLDWYMVIANHQSWVDILILQRVLNGKIPFLKFFLKKELIYVPVLGLAWWALDFPFMRRYTTAQLKKNPKLKGKDIEITRKACEKFKHKPVSVMNFVEGTRFTQAKHDKQNSPYQRLLRPKAGGMAFTLATMGDCMNTLVDVTIYYPKRTPTFWEYISGQVNEIYVHIDQSPIGSELKGDYVNDRAFKQSFQQALSDRWEQKDQTLSQLMRNSKEG